MLRDIRDIAIVVWVVMQGWGWFFPEVYGRFDAQAEVAYYEHMEKLGVWEE